MLVRFHCTYESVNFDHRDHEVILSGIRLSLPAVAGFSSVEKVARSMTTAGTLLQRAFHARTGIWVAVQRGLWEEGRALR
jgi:hypothetical protein